MAGVFLLAESDKTTSMWGKVYSRASKSYFQGVAIFFVASTVKGNEHGRYEKEQKVCGMLENAGRI
jgi:hypothetical protein